MRFPLLVLLLLASLGRGDALILRLGFEPGERWAYRETITGTGELTRHLPGGDQLVRLDTTAVSSREWLAESVGEAETTLTAVARQTRTKLVLPGATFEDSRPWRGFRLTVAPDGAIRSAEVLPSEPADEQAAPATPLPVDLDLGEVFAMLELGLLPPKALEPGESWEAANRGAGQVTASGRLVELVSEAGEQVALLETRYSAPVPELPTPAAGVVVGGTLSGLARVRFAAGAGRVLGARGPLDLRLLFRRRGSESILATVNLHLELDVAVVDQPAPRG